MVCGGMYAVRMPQILLLIKLGWIIMFWSELKLGQCRTGRPQNVRDRGRQGGNACGRGVWAENLHVQGCGAKIARGGALEDGIPAPQVANVGSKGARVENSPPQMPLLLYEKFLHSGARMQYATTVVPNYAVGVAAFHDTYVETRCNEI